MAADGRKIKGKWDKIFSPIFPEVKDLPHSSLCKTQVPALTNRKMGNFSPTPTATVATADGCH